MSWRIVQVTRTGRLSLSDEQLAFEEGGEKATVPLEDIAVVILENGRCTITGGLLSALADFNIALLTCDATFTPNGLFLAHAQHSRFTEAVRLQTGASAPLAKRLWQRVVQAKLANQAATLARLEKHVAAQRLRAMIPRVKSGDSDNREAAAAQAYWPALFDGFKRKGTGKRNAALNYAYAVLRSAVARAVCCAGFTPCLGIHHKSQLNAFNLADDLMEPFRPFADLLVARLMLDDSGELDRDTRATLAGLLTRDCVMGEERITLLKAAETSVFSFKAALREKQSGLWQAPIPLPLDSES